jgi:hypothetical protein
MGTKGMIGTVVLSLFVIAAISMAPDIARYMKIRAM